LASSTWPGSAWQRKYLKRYLAIDKARAYSQKNRMEDIENESPTPAKAWFSRVQPESAGAKPEAQVQKLG
jgi:hypothetical protein